MNVTVPLPILVGQWIALLALGALVVVVSRQFGRLMQEKEGAHVDTASLHGLHLGEAVPAFEGTVRNGHAKGQAVAWSPGRRPGVILFGDPLCGGCEKAALALQSLASAGRLSEFEVHILTTAEEGLVGAVPAFRDATISVVSVGPAVVLEQYGIQATPMFYVVGRDGRLAAAGSAVTERGILGLVGRLRNEGLDPLPMALSSGSN